MVLQFDAPSLGAGFASLILILCFAVFVILIQVAIVRWIFKINTQLNNQRATLWLLIKLCERNGVTKEDLDQIKTVFKIN